MMADENGMEVNGGQPGYGFSHTGNQMKKRSNDAIPIGLKIGNSVDFETTLGDKAIKQTFSLGSMTYDGKLDL